LAAAAASVEALKTQGNRAFLASRFHEALFRYTDAVQVALASQLGCVFRWLSVSLATEIGL
jgi:predicted nucleic acid-binding protein